MLIPLALMRTTVSVERTQGNTGDGERFGPPLPLRGLLNRHRVLMRSQSGDTTVAEAVLLLRPGAAIGIGDRVTHGDDTWVVEKVAPALVDGREHHLEVWLR